MTIFYIIFVIFIIVCGITVFATVTKDSIKENAIRINEAEANIEATLQKRFDLLNKSVDIIRNITKQEGEILKTLDDIKSQKLDNFELDKNIYTIIDEFHSYGENNAVLKENDEYAKIEIDLIASESEILALKEYYNDVAKKYNDIISAFPAMIIAKLKKYKNKDLFTIEDHSELINSLK